MDNRVAITNCTTEKFKKFVSEVKKVASLTNHKCASNETPQERYTFILDNHRVSIVRETKSKKLIITAQTNVLKKFENIYNNSIKQNSSSTSNINKIKKSKSIDNNQISQISQDKNTEKTLLSKLEIAQKKENNKSLQKENNETNSQSKYLSIEEILQEELNALSSNLSSKKPNKKQKIVKSSKIGNNEQDFPKNKKSIKKSNVKFNGHKTALKVSKTDSNDSLTNSAMCDKNSVKAEILPEILHQITSNEPEKEIKTVIKKKSDKKSKGTNVTTEKVKKDKAVSNLSSHKQKLLQNDDNQVIIQTFSQANSANYSDIKQISPQKKIGTKSKKQKNQVDKKVSEAQRKLKRKIPEAFEYMSEQSKIDLAIGFADIMNDDVKLSDYSMLLVPPYRGLERFIYDLQVAKNIEVKMIGQAFEKDALGQYKLKTGYMRRIKSVIYNEVLVALYTEYFNKRNFYAHSDNTLASSSRFISDKMVVKQIFQNLLELINYNCKKLKEIGFLYEPKKL